MLASVIVVKTEKPQEWGCASYFLLAESTRLRVSFLYFTLFRLLALCEVMGGTPWRPSQVGRGEFVVTIGYQQYVEKIVKDTRCLLVPPSNLLFKLRNADSGSCDQDYYYQDNQSQPRYKGDA